MPPLCPHTHPVSLPLVLSCPVLSKPACSGLCTDLGGEKEPPRAVSQWLCWTHAQGHGPCGCPRPPNPGAAAEPGPWGQPLPAWCRAGRHSQAWGLPTLPAHPRPVTCLSASPQPAQRGSESPVPAPGHAPECETAHLPPQTCCVFRLGQVQGGHGTVVSEQWSRAHIQAEMHGAPRWMSVVDISPESPRTPTAARRHSLLPLMVSLASFL